MYENSEYLDFLNYWNIPVNYVFLWCNCIIFYYLSSIFYVIYLSIYLSIHASLYPPFTHSRIMYESLYCPRLCAMVTLLNKINMELISVPKLNINLYHIAFLGHLRVTSPSLELREHLLSKDFI